MSPSKHGGRLAVVTGGGRGIGRAYAERLAAEGGRLVVVDLESPDEACAAISALGDGDATGIVCDVSDPDSVAALGEQVAAMGGADILVHNAGIYPMGPVTGITFEEWRKVFSVNLDSLFLLTQTFLPHMREQGWGRVIGVSSAMFHMGAPGSLHYVASKGGVIGFVRALAGEVGAEGVTVNAIAPGLIRSPGTSTGIHDELGLFDMVIEHQSIKRTGMPEDLAGVVSFLASDDAAYMTGQTLVVDGGTARA